ncbi:TnsD family Tn7-like transposition protein [Bacillus pseudomycoides]|uniref:TnsD family Tn7-like transposition protein n=1 Tax=Bacillus pseudomycoides TaxID=64104 RepID=UPI000BF3123D|nr:TnsD family Tn7-like transposition protein [Bacillus pseudomycoides]PGA70813.1 transposase [Bacillus pseudomycoides]PHE10629.1 transposase [Bacillus pseudomycoides]PHE91115.1 transposase [Bacillus pseudomycoides]
MIAYLLSLYLDELLYSWFARYHEHYGNNSPKHTMKELFGSASISAVVDLPANISAFCENIKRFNPPNSKELIEQHTLYKYYTFFQLEEVKTKALDYIENGGKPGAIHMLLGIAASTIKDWQYIRFCPSCVKQDRENYGEAYWHMLHQLPKVHYCHIHQELLQDSKVELRNPQKHVFISAEKTELDKPYLQTLYSQKTEQHLRKLSGESVKLIQINEQFDLIHIQQVYKYLMQINGYANYFGNVNQQYFTQQFKLHYGEEFLSLVDCNFDVNSDTSWVRSIVRKHRKAFHPVQHLLLLNFLGVSIIEINNVVGKEYKPFGEAPYYCLNPATSHYKGRVITDLSITNCTDTRKPVGTFTCSCGFIYSRRGPDQYQDDAFKVGRIKNFGEVWKAKLQRLVAQGLSYYAIAQVLECDYITIKKYAETKDNIVEPLSYSNLLQLKKETEWLNILKEHPYLNITEIRKLAPALYVWHYRNNRQWLKENSSKTHSRQTVNNRVDWNKRDLEVLAKVKKAIGELYAIEKPVYVNKSQIGKAIGQLSLLEKLLDKLPSTNAYLEKNLETRERYQIRRIKWACKVICENNDEHIMEWKVRRLAGLSNNLSMDVEQALQNEIRKYQQGGILFEVKTMDI